MTAPSRVIRAIEDRNARGIPVALAVHPWEIDPDPPRVKLPLAKSFAHYFRLGGFRGRLERILRGASFAPMGEVLGLLARSPHDGSRSRRDRPCGVRAAGAGARLSAADVKLRGIAIDQRSTPSRCRPTCPRSCRRSSGCRSKRTAFTGPAADATLTRLQEVARRCTRADTCRSCSRSDASRRLTATSSRWRQFVRAVAERSRGRRRRLPDRRRPGGRRAGRELGTSTC